MNEVIIKIIYCVFISFIPYFFDVSLSDPRLYVFIIINMIFVIVIEKITEINSANDRIKKGLEYERSLKKEKSL